MSLMKKEGKKRG